MFLMGCGSEDNLPPSVGDGAPTTEGSKPKIPIIGTVTQPPEVTFGNATRGVAVIIEDDDDNGLDDKDPVALYFTVQDERGTSDKEGIWRYQDGVLSQVLQVGKPGSIVQHPKTGTVYVSLPYASQIKTLDLDTYALSDFAGTGVRGFSGDGGQASAATFSYPWGLGIDSKKNYLYVSDTVNNRVRRIDLAGKEVGIITTTVGTGKAGYNGDGAALSVQIHSPGGLGTDSKGTLYFADTINSLVRKVVFDKTGKGEVTTVAGTVGSVCSCAVVGAKPPGCGDGGAALSATLNYPWGITVHKGSVLISDTRSCRVRLLTDASGTGKDVIEAYAGTGVNDYTGDGGAAIDATLSYPWDVHYSNEDFDEDEDGLGRPKLPDFIVFADSGNNAIRGIQDEDNEDDDPLFFEPGVPPEDTPVQPEWPPSE